MWTRISTSRRSAAYLAIIFMGIVSLLGDIVYEGSRGVVPEYLGLLGATSIVIGLVGGLGDFLGYALRLVSGLLVDATRAYWFFIFLGYGLIVSIPLMGVFPSLEAAVLLVLLERIGKAVRSPSRDTVLSLVSKEVGVGKAFGLHELLDQVGGVLGPALVSFMLFSTRSNYGYAFGILFFPFAALMCFLAYTYGKIGPPSVPKEVKTPQTRPRFGRLFLVYSLAVALNTAALIPYSLILFKASEIVRPLGQDWVVPMIYLLIQGIDAPAAFLSGHAFDRLGLRVLVFPFVLSIFPPLLAVLDSGLPVLAFSAALFGLVLGMQESVYRAAVSRMSPVSSRGSAYGVFHTAYGISLLAGGLVYGLLVQYNVPFFVTFGYVATMQCMAIALLLFVIADGGKRHRNA